MVYMHTIESLYRLSFRDVEKASFMLSDAFIDYPVFKHLFPDFNERRKKLKHVMSFFLKCGILNGEVFAPSKNLGGVSIWYKPSGLRFGVNGLIKAGLFRTIYFLNLKSFLRLKKLGDAKKENRGLILDREYYFLDVIGVNPTYKKKGYAKLLIDTMIEKMDSEGASCFLETSNANNLNYYRKYGFVPLGKYNYNGLESYCMIRN